MTSDPVILDINRRAEADYRRVLETLETLTDLPLPRHRAPDPIAAILKSMQAKSGPALRERRVRP